MKLLITGAGHSGGNWVTEIARATGAFNFTKEVEDRTFFFRNELPERYATKLATDNLGFYWENIHRMMDKNPDLHIILVQRHPIDNCLSKIARSIPSEDNEPVPDSFHYSWDGTMIGCIKAIELAYSLCRIFEHAYNNRFLTVKLEDLVRTPVEATKTICEFLDVEFKPEFVNAYKNTRNKWQKVRYKGEIDTSQVDMYKRIEEIYNSVFKGNHDMINYFKQHLDQIIRAWGYDE